MNIGDRQPVLRILLEIKYDREGSLKSRKSMTIKMCTADKDPGPDGFTMAFFQEAWEIMKKEVIETMIHLHHNCHMVTYVNDSFIALIPKKKGAVELKDYRPISLISSVYKTASKLLAKRLKPVI